MANDTVHLLSTYSLQVSTIEIRQKHDGIAARVLGALPFCLDKMDSMEGADSTKERSWLRCKRRGQSGHDLCLAGKLKTSDAWSSQNSSRQPGKKTIEEKQKRCPLKKRKACIGVPEPSQSSASRMR